MNQKSIIFNSELEFRKYLILNSKEIYKVYIFEDTLDQTIFFYCFFLNGIIVAAKESCTKDFYFYYKTYLKISNKLKLNSIKQHNNQKVLKLHKKSEI